MTEQGMRVVVADVLSEFLEVAIHMILFVRGIYPPELFASTQKYGCPIKTARHPGLASYIQQIVRSIRIELHKDTIHRICVVTLGPTKKALDRFVFEMSTLRAFEERILYSIDANSKQQKYQQQQQHQQQDRYANKNRVDKGKSKAIEDSYDPAHIRSDQEGVMDMHDDNQAEYEDEDPLQRASAHERQERQRNQQVQQHDYAYHQHQHSDPSWEGPRFGELMTLTTDVEAMFRAMLLRISVCDTHLKPLVQDCSFTVVIEMKAAGTGPDAKPEFPWSPISTSAQNERSKVSASAEEPSLKRNIIPVKTIDVADIQVELFIEQLDSVE